MTVDQQEGKKTDITKAAPRTHFLVQLNVRSEVPATRARPLTIRAEPTFSVAPATATSSSPSASVGAGLPNSPRQSNICLGTQARRSLSGFIATGSRRSTAGRLDG